MKNNKQQIDNSHNCRTLYNAQLFNQTFHVNRYQKIKEVDCNELIQKNDNFIFGNTTEQIIRKELVQKQVSKKQLKTQQYQQQQYIRRRVNTSYIVYPIENIRNLSYQKQKENEQPKLMYHVQIPDTLKIPYINKKNKLIRNYLQQNQGNRYKQYEDIQIASRVSFHTKQRQSSNIKKPQVNEQLQLILDEHQLTEQSFINGWE